LSGHVLRDQAGTDPRPARARSREPRRTGSDRSPDFRRVARFVPPLVRPAMPLAQGQSLGHLVWDGDSVARRADRIEGTCLAAHSPPNRPNMGPFWGLVGLEDKGPSNHPERMGFEVASCEREASARRVSPALDRSRRDPAMALAIVSYRKISKNVPSCESFS